MRWACLAGFLVMVRSLLYTYSRGAYLALMVATASMLLLRNPIFLIGGIAVGFGADSVGLVPDSVRSRLGHSQKDDVEIYDPDVTANLDSSAQKRIVLWGAAREMIAAYPWRGVGLNRFEYEVDTYVDTPLDARHPRDAHNAYLLTAAEMGLPALVLMILLLVSLLLAALATHFSRRRDRFDRGLALGLVGTISGVATSCMLGSRFSDDGVIGYFWMLAALLIVVRGLGRHAESGDESPSAGRS